MQPFQQQFLETAIACGALRFGEFELKSGRISPYFFNAGAFASGAELAVLGHCYAAAIGAAGLAFDQLFGPAYKGIPLATATAIALSEQRKIPVPVSFNRKERKSHGEGGVIMGAPLQGRVLILDDVITAGTAIRESIELIQAQGASVAGAVLALDREERGQGDRSAVQELREEQGFPVTCIAGLSQLVEFLDTVAGGQPEQQRYAGEIRKYRDRYGVR